MTEGRITEPPPVGGASRVAFALSDGASDRGLPRRPRGEGRVGVRRRLRRSRRTRRRRRERHDPSPSRWQRTIDTDRCETRRESVSDGRRRVRLRRRADHRPVAQGPEGRRGAQTWRQMLAMAWLPRNKFLILPRILSGGRARLDGLWDTDCCAPGRGFAGAHERVCRRGFAGAHERD